MRGVIGIATFMAALAGGALSQTRQGFEVATIRPSAPLDMVKMAADMQAGKMPRMGAHVDGARADYLYMTLRDLMALGYGVKPYQVTGPDWIKTQRFDIAAKIPEGVKKDDAPAMLRALLEERFKMTTHKSTEEHPVLALVVGKGGPKLKESATQPKPIDESVPLKAGEMTTEGPDGPVRMSVSRDGHATVNMGAKGVMNYGMNPATQSLHLEGDMITMSGFADMLTQFSQMGGGGGRRVVDMTGLTGHYEVAMDFALADLLQMARAAGIALPAGVGGGPAAAGPADAASDPGGAASSITTAVQALGLRLETRKAPVEQLVIDRVEKTPTEN